MHAPTSTSRSRRTPRSRLSPPSPAGLLHRRRDVLDLPRNDLLLDQLRLRLDPLRRLRRELAEADALLLEAVDGVLPALEVAVLRVLDREEDSLVDALQRRGEDVRAEEALVGVDPDAPDLLLFRGVERTEPAAARDLEDDHGARRDLIQRDLLALRLDREVLRVTVQRLDSREGGLRPRLEACDVAVDRRLLLAADRRDGGAPARLRREARGVAGEIADLLLPEEQPFHVLRFALVGVRDVDDREMRLRELLRDRGHRLDLGEADADHQVVALVGERRQARHVVGR